MWVTSRPTSLTGESALPSPLRVMTPWSLAEGGTLVLHQEGMRSLVSITSAAPSALNLTVSDTDIKLVSAHCVSI